MTQRLCGVVSASVVRAVGFAFLVAACSSATSPDGATSPGAGGTSAAKGGSNGAGASAAGPGGAGGGGGAAASSCVACVTEMDCTGGGMCAQFAGSDYCAPPCGAGMQCASGSMCATVVDYQGKQVDVCVPVTSCGSGLGGASGASGTGGAGPGAGGSPPTEMCGSLAGPSVAGCCSCSAGNTCAANNCYGGWWCNHDSCKCQPAPDPATCGGPMGGGGAGQGGGTGVGGAPPVGTVGPNGGTLDNLQFAIVGDTRPAAYNDTAGYPTAIITQIWKQVETEQVPFAVMTGDYQFAVGAETTKQLDLYLSARSNFSKIAFPAMGNHECTGATASNCGNGNANGTTPNYLNFIAKFLAPIGQKLPYYAIDVNATNGSWTSKFVFVAANAWDSYQATWLMGAMAKPTTYTFVVRHESSQANTAPGVTPSDAIIKQFPWTLLLVGHTHNMEYFANEKQVIVGNGGAPLAGSAPYGYVVATRRPSDNALIFQAKDYTQKKIFKSFNVKPDGSVAP